MGLTNTILGIIFPLKCLLCGKSGIDLCLECLQDAPSAERESAKWIFPIFDYRHPAIKKSLWLLKYNGRKRLANVFAEIIYGKIMEELAELSVMENFSAPILVPIPLSKKRYRERGFNQTELICRELIKIDKTNKKKNFILEDSILIKPNDTEHQARIKDRTQRLKNISGSFSIQKGSDIKGKNIILIDDILTTGATLSEARKVLRQAGARKIIAFAVAH
ncbi:ComF family protein [Candidatus Nomurabacteria bacterium]|nr:ComF family protein [Candidatus Nomurabacteria bacterium]